MPGMNDSVYLNVSHWVGIFKIYGILLSLWNHFMISQVLFTLPSNMSLHISNLVIIGATLELHNNSTLYTNNTFATGAYISVFSSTLFISHNLELRGIFFKQFCFRKFMHKCSLFFLNSLRLKTKH